jgi:hypothetical protein
VSKKQAVSLSGDEVLCGVIQTDIDWNGKNWARSCEFLGKNLTSVKTDNSMCGNKCLDTRFCSHFVWSAYENGTCWMKKGDVQKSDAVGTLEKSIICGIIECMQFEDFLYSSFKK